MRLLICTQKINKNDPILGFFHTWVEMLAAHYEHITVICLEKGEHTLPANVSVYSLGKEIGKTKIEYIREFYRHVLGERNNYDSVFVHMNQEYILLGGLFWKLFGKKVYMWRNHHAGNILTDIAAAFCTKTFSTSKYSYTVKYQKNTIMPVGINTNTFTPQEGSHKKRNAILFIARIAPIKRPDLLIDALEVLEQEGIDFSASFFGDPNEDDKAYYKILQQRVNEGRLKDSVTFHHGVPNHETPKVFSEHGISVNLSTSGMYDKTIFEALSCGTLTVASNENLHGLIPDTFLFKEGDLKSLVRVLKTSLNFSEEEYRVYAKDLRAVVEEKHSLTLLLQRLVEETTL